MSGWLVALGVAVAGGLGAVTRYLLERVIVGIRHSRIPMGSFVVNVIGSFALGWVTGLAARGVLAPEVRVIVGTGFLGGYTTFSSACLEGASLLAERKLTLAALHSVGMLILGVLAAAAGLWLGGI